MRWFFLTTLLYAIMALTLAGSIHGFRVGLFLDALAETRGILFVFTYSLKYAALPLLGLGLLIGWQVVRGRLGDIAYVTLGTILFQIGFSFVKASIPFLVPFHADPALAAADAWLHGGADAWQWFYPGGQPLLTPRTSALIYIYVWSVVMMLFPLLVVVTDRDPARVNRTLILYLATWVILGNFFATLGSSVGPVFHDKLIGGDRFADLVSALQSSGMSDSDFGPVQDYLWQAYVAQSSALGSGISAFPSMHVAMAALPAIYLVERSIWFAPVAIGYVVLVQIVSVTSGYHYALDGYVSILCVVLGRAGIEILARQRHRVLAVRQLDLEDALAEMPEGQF
jgi:hypothetical protein